MSAADKVKPAASPASEDPSAIAGNISYHAQYSPHFSPLAFGPEQAFYATAESVRDHLLQRWNDTYLHFHKTDPKQTYYLSMEYLQGRALTNAVGNLAITGAYADALKKFGYELEAIAGQERDAALGNGGLGRLASCFLDSMATLNLPSWGYGLRYRYGLFKQRIAKEGQEEIAEDWLDKFSPWEIVRHDVVYPIRFFGHVEISPDGKRKWAGGEVLNALAYDVPIPGYKTKNAISLRLWDATATAEDFNLFQFNDGQYESAAQLHSRAQQICAVLYPGDATEEGKLLRLKQQYFLCSASLQDIIFRFKERKADRVSGKWTRYTFADDEKLHAEWAAAKLASKKRLAKHVLDVTGVTIDPDSLFDIQIKRIHEYKRQLMNILGAVYRYKKLKEMSAADRQKVTPRTVMVGGKAFATYTNAKRIVKLVNDVGAVVNNDADVNKYLKVVFIPNYNVSVAEVLIPGSELSQHISTAGMEASGTSNMKFSLNGCVIIGTLDGANVEIREEVGQDNFFLFGAKADQVAGLRKDRENGLFKPDPRFEEAKQFIRSGAFGTYDYTPLLDSLEGNTGFGRGDYFLVGYDFPSYIDAQARVDEAYKDKKKWVKMSILNTAGSGKFSSDRTIDQYAKEIWGISACPVP
ncbi:unnamed protein product [Triticum turgidum subsp. durum]|uniref:Alpha-1,4 glucan phosphorylase n=1 Tax=Triticum turgidum subsp. durum TaxID=4567 RepID=A0A9R0RXA2_TRITD|nr:unnamed protein product [Triticum turgidum subsp. durum]